MNARPHMSIGDVLSLLREEFSDVTISKIRFLESQGLVNPERSASGYRKFYPQDVDRLRWVLRQQREHFLPLKVIRDRLDAEGGGIPSDDIVQAPGEAGGEDRGDAPGALAETVPGGAPPGATEDQAGSGGPARNGASAGQTGSAPEEGPGGLAVPPGTTECDEGPRATRGMGTEEPPAANPLGELPGHPPAPVPAPTPAAATLPGLNGFGPDPDGADDKPRPVAAQRVPPVASDAFPAALPGPDNARWAGPGPRFERSTDGRLGDLGDPTALPGDLVPAMDRGAPEPLAVPAGSTSVPVPPPGSLGAPTLAGGSGPGEPSGTGTGLGGGTVEGSATSGYASSGEGPSGPPQGAHLAAPAHSPAPAAPAPSPPRGPSEGGPKGPGVPGPKGPGVPGPLGDLTGASLTAEELAAASGMSTGEVAALEAQGLFGALVVAGVPYYDQEALLVARLVAEFGRFGIEPRHLRLYRNAVEREVGLIEQVITPLLRQRNPEARQRAVETADELVRLGEALRAALVRRELRSQFGT